MYVQALGSPCQLCPRVYLFDFVAVPGISADTSRAFAPNETLAMAHGKSNIYQSIIFNNLCIGAAQLTDSGIIIINLIAYRVIITIIYL